MTKKKNSGSQKEINERVKYCVRFIEEAGELDANIEADGEETPNGIDEDYVASEGNFEDSEFQFNEESEESGMNWTKELVPTVQGISANVEFRLCVKHLYGNWKKKHPGLKLKEVLWEAVRATTVPTWEREMQRMKAMKVDAWKDMLDVPACHWSGSHFRTYSKCDLQVNNRCEAFNREILEHGEKPIITILEGIKHYVTKKMTNQKELLHGYTGSICPKIQLIIENNKKQAQGWTPTWHDNLNTVTPPVMRRVIGRPKKQRNKTNDEPRNLHILPRRFSIVTCAKCGAMGHNKRSCKDKREVGRAISKGGNKSKKTNKVKGGKGTKKSKEKKTKFSQSLQAPQPTQE
ncbi:hypothetical protein KIW84_045714 [Lathyrus oleraceus]|uniref:CCHC-type domain-containing protein n=1 Tax=Pisum sativum TaxID=3888 RepID=A0A9D4XLD3_PEA|nr:hypothetical protein KIW84_045714 [Pisum sativum]